APARPRARAAARPPAPALPAGGVHVALVPLQVSAVHGLPSATHAAPLGCVVSVGHAALVPVQVSARSHSPAAARQTVLEGLKASVGQASLVPSQVSAWSQTPAAARHTVPAGCFPSAGQGVVVPSQDSAPSQAPAAARHTAPAMAAGCVTLSPLPLHAYAATGLRLSVPP